MPKIDLHMHSNASDGIYAPEKVVQLALERNLEFIALTDHDTIEGISKAQSAAQNSDLEVITGIELGVENGPRDVHILGYDIDPTYQPLQEKLQAMREYRKHRAEKIVENLNNLDIPVTYERIIELAGNGVIARPHIAKAMMEVGAVKDYQEAFDKYISNDSPAYVPRLRISPKEGIDLIHEAGGVVVIAHPCRYTDPIGVVREFAGQGADGVEIFYPDNDAELRTELFAIAEELDLIVTGGCDFHRPKGDGSLVMGCEDVPLSAVESIKSRVQKYK